MLTVKYIIQNLHCISQVCTSTQQPRKSVLTQEQSVGAVGQRTAANTKTIVRRRKKFGWLSGLINLPLTRLSDNNQQQERGKSLVASVTGITNISASIIIFQQNSCLLKTSRSKESGVSTGRILAIQWKNFNSYQFPRFPNIPQPGPESRLSPAPAVSPDAACHQPDYFLTFLSFFSMW